MAHAQPAPPGCVSMLANDTYSVSSCLCTCCTHVQTTFGLVCTHMCTIRGAAHTVSIRVVTTRCIHSQSHDMFKSEVEQIAAKAEKSVAACCRGLARSSQHPVSAR